MPASSAARPRAPGPVAGSQVSQLLAGLFEQFEPEQAISVLHVGPALPETVAFFSRYRCKLQFLDLFGELPLAPGEEDGDDERRLAALAQFPAGTRFDLCLFWDLFNYLPPRCVTTLASCLEPHLQPRALGHGFGVHNVRSPQQARVYGIREVDQLTVRPRPAPLPGYRPHPQSRLQELLGGFEFLRTVLLADSRLELLLRRRAPAN